MVRGLVGELFERPGEEGVAEVPDQGAEQHRRPAPERSSEGVGTEAPPRGLAHDALPSLPRDGHARWGVVEDP